MDFLFKDVVVRKEHKCWCCCGTIPIGRKVQFQKVFDAGEVWSFYYCEICAALISTIRKFWDTFPDGISEGEFTDEYWVERWLVAAHEFEERTGTSYNTAVMQPGAKQHVGVPAA